MRQTDDKQTDHATEK